MTKEKIRAPVFDDIVFEYRNKEYGAYRLRKNYNRNVIIALFIGIIIMAAKNLGIAKYLTGLIAIVSSASICSVTFIVPSSAAIEAPTLPAITIPVRTGPSSVIIALLVAAPRNERGAIPFNW